MTSHLQSLTMSTQSLWAWCKKESMMLTHIGKLCLAGILAILLSLLFDLEQPRTALITVAIVMQTHSGMVLSKSYYRLLGTIAGIGMSLLLVALFAQQPFLFLISMALWIGLCTAGSIILRDHQSYAFVLAGYTLCIVGLPATLNANYSFDIAMNRISEIMIGLVCATTVSELILPRRMGETIAHALRQRFIDFTYLLNTSITEQNNKVAVMQLMNDIFRLESYQASSTLESDQSRSLRLKLTRLNREFMSLATSHHTLIELLRRLTEQQAHTTITILNKIYQRLVQSIHINGQAIVNESQAQLAIQQLNHLENNLAESTHSNHQSPSLNSPELSTGLVLIRRLLSEIKLYLTTYSALSNNQPSFDPPPLGIHFEPLSALLGGIRGALVLVIMASVWLLSAWPSGIEAITMAVVATTLFATSPAPSKTVKQFVIGGFIGALLGYWVNFNLLVEANDFTTLIIAILPGIVIASAFTAKPDKAVIGAGMFIIYLSHLGFSKTYQDNQLAFFNDVIADFIGLFCSAIMYQLMDLQSNSWLQKRTIRSLQQLVVDACLTTQTLRREKFELAARELIYRSGSTHKVSEKTDQQVITWFFICLEMGYLIINIQKEIITLNNTILHNLFNSMSQTLAQLFKQCEESSFQECITSLDKLLTYLDHEEGSKYYSINSELRLLKEALIDNQRFFVLQGESS
ncbi:FUSC family protein [Ferrovum sp. PN-J185]|uniref:FUSC family protein n=1 Tax=Ferrovum sp. PN-J185 TaxID=1356306 RepID=UPI000799F42A|nr:FUSC family protein [Ferrovum sp. PN-J185]KXW56237.1 p-hydroxybenzoic acid efflux pump subunit AaeB [Ferrovum sp. PN-J185]